MSTLHLPGGLTSSIKPLQGLAAYIYVYDDTHKVTVPHPASLIELPSGEHLVWTQSGDCYFLEKGWRATVARPETATTLN